MATLETPLAQQLAETAHWGDDPPVSIEEQEFDLLAFELWHLGRNPDLLELEEWEDAQSIVASPSSCL